MATIPCMAIGPFGGKGGEYPYNDGPYNAIRKMIIQYGDIVNSIQIEYDNNGESKLSEVHGGRGGKPGNRVEVKLDYENNHEFLISMSGYYTTYNGLVIIGSLTMTSNKNQYGPFGKNGKEHGGEYFTTLSSITGGKIVGFFGRSGWYLDSIGAYFPAFGGSGGKPFDDGTYTTVKRIVVRHSDGSDGFVSIQIVYDNNGVEHWSDDHGTTGGGSISEVSPLTELVTVAF